MENENAFKKLHEETIQWKKILCSLSGTKKLLLKMSEVYKLMYRFQNFFLKKCPVAGIYLDEKDFNIILREQKV